MISQAYGNVENYYNNIQEWYGGNGLGIRNNGNFGRKENCGKAQLGQMKFNSFYDNIRSTNQPNRPSTKHFQHFKAKINRAIIDNYFYLESDET